jgi:diadenosine tetraphosphate (Ap4A) HIT family hydrolase
MIERVFAPCHMNYQLLGNIVPHLHVHLVTRLRSSVVCAHLP